MRLNIKLSGVAGQAISDMIKQGYAGTKTGAVRMAVLHYAQHVMVRDDSVGRMTCSNRDIWSDEAEDLVWSKYITKTREPGSRKR